MQMVKTLLLKDSFKTSCTKRELFPRDVYFRQNLWFVYMTTSLFDKCSPSVILLSGMAITGCVVQPLNVFEECKGSL